MTRAHKTKELRSAYLLLALRGVQRLLSQGELSVSQGVANARTTWRVSTSTPVRWISEATIPGKPTDAIRIFDSKWNDINTRMEIIPGKTVFNALNKYIGDEYHVSLTAIAVISSFSREEILRDMVALLRQIDRFRVTL